MSKDSSPPPTEAEPHDYEVRIASYQQRLADQSAIIATQLEQLVAQERVIRSLARFRFTSLHYWALIILGILWISVRWMLPVTFRNRVKDQVKPMLAQAEKFIRQIYKRVFSIDKVLYQYDPIPLVIAPHYHETPPPTGPNLPTVSIVTPSYNAAPFIERTITSILNQGYPSLEYVIQDGGSTDDTMAVVQQYRAQLAHVDSRPDRGQAHALNRGFAHTSGEIMGWLNADDMLLPGALNYVVDFFQQHPTVDVVYGHRINIDAHDNEVGRWLLPDHDLDILKWADYIPQETLFWRRRIWNLAGSQLDETFEFALDWDLLLRFQQAGARFVRLPRFLGAFRIHANQKTLALNTVGQEEMAVLRKRCHGRVVTWLEIKQHTYSYLLRSAWMNLRYRWGLVRH